MASLAECRCCRASCLATRWPVSVSTPEKTCCFERGLLSDCVLKTRTPPRDPERSGAGNPSRRRARRGTGPLASERPCGPLPPLGAASCGLAVNSLHSPCTASRHQRNTWGMLVRRAMRSTSRGRLPSILVSLVLATMQTTCSPPEKHQKVRHTKRQYRLQQQSSTAI